MRFRSEQHLSRQSDIRAVREQGRRIDCRIFTLWWKHRAAVAGVIAEEIGKRANLPASSTQARVSAGARVCVIASTAAVGGAVRRNRAKRRLRETFRAHQASVPDGCDLLLIARAAATGCPMAELGKRFTDACRQIAPPTPQA